MPSQIVTDKYRRETEKAYTPHDQKEPSDLLERIAWSSHQISQPLLYNQGGGIQAQRTHYTKCVIGHWEKGKEVQLRLPQYPAQTTSKRKHSGNYCYLSLAFKAYEDLRGGEDDSWVTITAPQSATIHENLQQKITQFPDKQQL